MLRNEVRYTTSTMRGVPGCAESRHGRRRAAEPVWRRRVRQGRADHRHRVPGPDGVVRPDGGHGRRRDGGGAGRLAIRHAAGVGLRAQRRLPAGAAAPGADDRRRPVPRMGPPHRRRLHRRGAARQPRRAERPVELRRRTRATARCGCATTATSWSSASCSSTRSSTIGRRLAPRSGGPSSRACSIASSNPPIRTACSTTPSTPRRSRRRATGCRTTGATSTAPSTPSTSARARRATETPSGASSRNLPKYRNYVVGAAQHPGAAAGVV